MNGIKKIFIAGGFLLSPFFSFAFENIVITEVMYNPIAPDTAGEWFELYNGTDQDIDISSWEFSDGEGVVIIPDGVEIKSGDYFIAAHTAVAGNLRDFPGVLVDLEYSSIDVGSISLANGGDELLIRNSSADVVDQVSWGGGFRYAISSGDGESILRVPDSDESSASDWLSNQLPTPGDGSHSEPDDQGVISGSSSNKRNKKSASVRFGCKDQKSLNYKRFSRHKQSLCKYSSDSFVTNSCLKYELGSTMLLQKCLTKKGFSPQYHDGIFGLLTQKALLDYKKSLSR